MGSRLGMNNRASYRGRDCLTKPAQMKDNIHIRRIDSRKSVVIHDRCTILVKYIVSPLIRKISRKESLHNLKRCSSRSSLSRSWRVMSQPKYVSKNYVRKQPFRFRCDIRATHLRKLMLFEELVLRLNKKVYRWQVIFNLRAGIVAYMK